MKSHVLRPLWVAIVLVAAILVAREFMVPDDFGVHGKSFTYNFYRLGNVEEWKDVPAKYRGRERCVKCHKDNSATMADSKHVNMQCENCHGPWRRSSAEDKETAGGRFTGPVSQVSPVFALSNEPEK